MPPKLEVGGRMLLFQFSNFSYISRKVPKRENFAFWEKCSKKKRSFYGKYQGKYGFEGCFWVVSGQLVDNKETIYLLYTTTPYFRSIY